MSNYKLINQSKEGNKEWVCVCVRVFCRGYGFPRFVRFIFLVLLGYVRRGGSA